MKKSIIISLLAATCFAVGFTTKDFVLENISSIGNKFNGTESLVNQSLDAGETEVVEVESSLESETKFGFVTEDVNEDITFGTPWKSNSLNDKFLAIEGRGVEALEEGTGFIYLKSGDRITSIGLDSKGDGLAPKYVEWCGEDEFLVYMVNKYGRVHTGGTLYRVNINDMIPKIVYTCSNYEEISEATLIDADTINIKTLEHKEEAVVSAEKNIRIK